jgi:hypothetical protein
MIVSQQILSTVGSEISPFEDKAGEKLLLVFAPREWVTDEDFLSRLRKACPEGTKIAGCSSSGEISGSGALDDSAVLTFITFESTQVELVTQTCLGMDLSEETGIKLATAVLERCPQPSSVLIFSDGLNVNGSRLVEGLYSVLAPICPFSGGMAGDGAKFIQTSVIVDGRSAPNSVLAVVLKGAKLKSSTASVSGWCPFGSFRQVTESTANYLDQLDEASALSVYSSYLGRDAENLPFSGLLYPLEVHQADGSPPVIRTLLAVDQDSGRLTFAGDVPKGSTVRLMNASYDQLVEGAGQAAKIASEKVESPALALLISCVGRKLALASYTDLEVDAVKEALPPETVITGFHSYGEMGFDEGAQRIQLHNQTMTVTLLTEN